MYRVKWSPFVPDVFLSCSADWTVKLWHQNYPSPLHSFQAAQVEWGVGVGGGVVACVVMFQLCCLQKAINDICWSPMDSTMFGCVSEGRVEIWGMNHSV